MRATGTEQRADVPAGGPAAGLTAGAAAIIDEMMSVKQAWTEGSEAPQLKEKQKGPLTLKPVEAASGPSSRQ